MVFNLFFIVWQSKRSIVKRKTFMKFTKGSAANSPRWDEFSYELAFLVFLDKDNKP